MKKGMSIVLLLAVLLCGCQKQEAYETMHDELPQLEKPVAYAPVFNLPGDALEQVFAGENTGKVYFCDGYVLSMQVLPGGDLQSTVQQTSGFASERLPMMKTEQEDATRYEFVWTAVGETGSQMCRCAILDDRNYHYVLTAMADANQAGELTQTAWNALFSSFRLIHPEDVVNSGS